MKMSENKLNFYDHIEWLKTIYVSKLDELNKCDEKTDKLQKEIEQLNGIVGDYGNLIDSLRSTIKKKDLDLCTIKTRLEIVEKELDFLKSTTNYAEDLLDKYYKIPKWIRRIFVSE